MSCGLKRREKQLFNGLKSRDLWIETYKLTDENVEQNENAVVYRENFVESLKKQQKNRVLNLT